MLPPPNVCGRGAAQLVEVFGPGCFFRLLVVICLEMAQCLCLSSIIYENKTIMCFRTLHFSYIKRKIDYA